MIKLFKKKSQVDILEKQYRRLLKEAHALSVSNRKASDEKAAEAEKILKEIDHLMAQNKQS